MQQYIVAVRKMLEIKEEEPTTAEPEKQDQETKEGAKKTQPQKLKMLGQKSALNRSRSHVAESSGLGSNEI